MSAKRRAPLYAIWRVSGVARQLSGFISTIQDDRLYRQLIEATQGRGGDVFLADPQHRYLGRTCPWKRCAPGIRVSCDALHCGRRPFLHDDWDAIKLPAKLVA